jgi:rod shape-determining protein MreC
MNKQRFIIILAIFVGISGALYFSPFLQSPFSNLSTIIKTTYLNQLQALDNAYIRHISQSQTIADLQRRNALYEKEILTLHQVAHEYQNLLQEHNSTFEITPTIELVRTLSYVRMGDPHKLWLEMEYFSPDRVYGLLYRGVVAGIVVSRNKRPMALLNGDPKSSYAVTVGNSQAPGIARGTNSRRLLVEFIPTWIPVSVGDEVTTSGLDQIFLSGLKVGKIVSISRSSGYQNAIIEPYFYAKNPTYFHVITKAR